MRLIKQPTYIIDSIETIHFDKNGKILSKRILNNGKFHRFLKWLRLAHDSMTNTGFAAIAGLIGNTGAIVAFTVIGIGTGTNAAGATDTQLQTPAVLIAATVSRVTTGPTNDTLNLVHSFVAADGLSGTAQAITEVGAFNGTVNGTSIMMLRQKYTPADTMNWDQGDSLQVTVKVQVKQGA